MLKTHRHYQLAIAAYLHDIGKLFWRAGYDRNTELSTDFNTGIIYSLNVAHAQFVKDFFWEAGQGYEYDGEVSLSNRWKELALYSCLHHGIDMNNYIDSFTPDEQIIIRSLYMGDNRGSSSDRKQDYLEENKRSAKTKKAHLSSVFENLFLTKERPGSEYILDPTTLTESDMVPKRRENEILGFGDLGKKARRKLVELVEDFAGCDENSSLERLDTLLHQLDIYAQEFFSLVPSDSYTSDMNDVSLYDHTKMVVASSLIIYDQIIENTWTYERNLRKIKNSEKFFDDFGDIALIAGDFPSIGKYIEKAMSHSSGLAKRLRARSMRVQLLNEAVIQYILENIMGSRAQVVLNAGGKFVIFAPKGVAGKALACVDEINTRLYDRYGTDVKINAVSRYAASREVFSLNEGNLNQVLVDLYDSLATNKYQIYNRNHYKEIFSEQKNIGQNKNRFDDEGEGEPNLHFAADKEFGEELAHMDNRDTIFVQYKNDNNKRYFSLGSQAKGVSPRNCILVQCNDRTLKNTNIKTIAKSINYYVPKDNNKIKEFDILASIKQNYLAIIQGDIDSMSIVLKHGLFYYNYSEGVYVRRKSKSDPTKDAGMYSISRLSQISRYLELFFGKITHQRLQASHRDVYTIYSGGDDFIFITSFDERHRFVDDYHAWFAAHTSLTESLHFSTSMLIFKNKTPLRQVIQRSEEQLASVKRHCKEEMVDRNELDIKGHAAYHSDYIYEYSSYYNKKDEFYSALFSGREKNRSHIGSLMKEYKTDNMSDTTLYKIYTTLGNMVDSLGEKDYIQVMVQGSRLRYMSARLGLGNHPIMRDLSAVAVGKDNQTIEKYSKMRTQILDMLYEKRESVE